MNRHGMKRIVCYDRVAFVDRNLAPASGESNP